MSAADKITDIVNAYVTLTPLTEVDAYNPYNYTGDNRTYEYYYTGSQKGQMTRQKPAFETARAVVPPGMTPILMPIIISKEFPPMADGSHEGRRHHQGLSLAAIFETIRAMRPDKRTFYETIRAAVNFNPGDAEVQDPLLIAPAAPVDPHFDYDLDTTAHPDRSVKTARILFETYFRRWAAAHSEVDIDPETIREVVLTATRPGKESQHIIWKLPGHAKFETNLAWGNVVAEVLVLAVEDLGLADNPLFVKKMRGTKNGTMEPYYVSIVDTAIYTPHRTFRFEGCVKAKLDAKRALYPLVQPDEERIEDRTLSKFASTLVTYLPRDPATGAPLAFPVIPYQSPLIVPEEGINKYLNKFFLGDSPGFTTNLHAANSTIGGATIIGRKRPADSSVAAPLEATEHGEEGEEDEEESADDDDDAPPRAVSISRLASVICRVLNRHHPGVNATKKATWTNGMIQIDSTSRKCVYARREHKHNTIFFMAFLGFPKPQVFYYCRDVVDCQHLYARIPKARIPVDLPSDAWDAEYTPLMHRYMLSQTVTVSTLAKLFEPT